jgi:Fur family ferric uptake transcriptional regulator
VTTLPDTAALLRDAGLRVTRPRLAVLQALQQAPHSDVPRLLPLVRGEIGTVSVQAVYDVLHALAGAGLVRRVEPAGSSALFELRVGDNHHHIVCRVCGAAADVDCAVGSAPCLDPSQTHGFLVDEAEVTFWGVCPTCRSEGGTTVRERSALSGDRPTSASATSEGAA